MIPMMPPTIPQFDVPLYYQISDISSVEWQKKGCGVADIAMLVEFYKPNTTSVQKVLEEALASGAYVKNVGWSHQGLADLAGKYGLVGKTYDFSKSDKETAFNQFKNVLKEGPVIASIRRDFDPKSSFGHLIVVTGLDENFVYYNDPGKREGFRKVSIADFNKGWKKRLIVLRLPETKPEIALAKTKQ
jgi:ABC-type bacteriocin/lantibiotic exporter with double-glycine peptidase domain